MIACMDFEYNCGWSRRRSVEEVIQYGLVITEHEGSGTEVLAESCYVKPVFVPKLDKHIMKLTGIVQETVDTQGKSPKEAFARLFELIDEYQIATIYIWGSDKKVLTEYLQSHEVGGLRRQRVGFLKKLCDVSDEFSADVSRQAVSLGDMAFLCDYEPEAAHDALADARTLKEILVHYCREGLNEEKAADYRVFVNDRQLFARLKSVIGVLRRNGLTDEELLKWTQECLNDGKMPEYVLWRESWQRENPVLPEESEH